VQRPSLLSVASSGILHYRAFCAARGALTHVGLYPTARGAALFSHCTALMGATGRRPATVVWRVHAGGQPAAVWLLRLDALSRGRARGDALRPHVLPRGHLRVPPD